MKGQIALMAWAGLEKIGFSIAEWRESAELIACESSHAAVRFHVFTLARLQLVTQQVTP